MIGASGHVQPRAVNVVNVRVDVKRVKPRLKRQIGYTGIQRARDLAIIIYRTGK